VGRLGDEDGATSLTLMAPVCGPELRILELFPPGRCRRILAYLARHQPEIDDNTRRGVVCFDLGTNRRGEGVASTGGPHWKPEEIVL
jgi:hypothetical protein